MDFKEIFGSNKPRCQGFKEDGSRCKTDPQTGKKFCFMHDPNQKEKQAEARRKGGETRNQLYPRKIPPTFRYQAPQDHYEVEALLDQIALYYTQDEMDLRSARFYCYIVMGKLGIWNSFARLQSRVSRDAENQARIMRREKDPWSPQYGALARAAKAKEEAEKTAQTQIEAEANPAQESQVSHWSENEDLRTGPLILGTSTVSSETQSRANRARAAEGAEPTGSEKTNEATRKRPPQSARNKEDEQRQQRIMQSDMNELTERVAEEVRAEAYKKGEWRRKRRW